MKIHQMTKDQIEEAISRLKKEGGELSLYFRHLSQELAKRK